MEQTSTITSQYRPAGYRIPDISTNRPLNEHLPNDHLLDDYFRGHFSNENLHANTLLNNYIEVRRRTELLARPLEAEDMVIQSMPDASPTKWHLAHTSWFFETFLLMERMANYRVFNPAFKFLFNSYYETVGAHLPRTRRGLASRPTLREIGQYRRYIDEQMYNLLQRPVSTATESLVRLGLAHEQQHQELILMDVLHLFSQSPLRPAYDETWPPMSGGRQGQFKHCNGGRIDIGANSTDGFVFDNELPRHIQWLQPFEISDRLVTNAEWLEFIGDDGYRRPELWLSDGWDLLQAQHWSAPLYWQRSAADSQRCVPASQSAEGWQQMTLRGLTPLDPRAAVTNISYFEAAAFACWRDARLPTEAEWEHAARCGVLEQIDDSAWQWTQSAYSAYPGFKPSSDSIGEYNGKFMIGQMVLRGGSQLTPRGHCRLSYRNFFRPEQRWVCSGLRLARDAQSLAPAAEWGEPSVETSGNALAAAPDTARAATPDNTLATMPDSAQFAVDVFAGLTAERKALAPKYFYDATGSQLFEAICATPEYYPTRSEITLLERMAGEIAAAIPAGSALVEFGSGASIKTRLLLDAAPQISTYVPIDISRNALREAAASLAVDYPQLNIVPIAADFSTAALPNAIRQCEKVGFFPGSTIGNFTADEAVLFLDTARHLLGKNALLILGADLIKDEATLLAAYNDAGGVTASFNKNLLARINRELGGNFDVDAFEHVALWNARQNRIEMYLRSRSDQIVNAGGHTFAFHGGELLHTEYSHKFTIEHIAELAAQSGWNLLQTWISEAPQFGVFLLRSNS